MRHVPRYVHAGSEEQKALDPKKDHAIVVYSREQREELAKRIAERRVREGIDLL